MGIELDLYVHYPTDILGGALLGCLCGYMTYRLVSVIKFSEN